MMGGRIVGLGALSFAIAMVVTSAVARGPGGGAFATTPTPPADCYVASEPSEAGPEAPSGLTAEWSPYYDGDILLDAYDVVHWTDNSDDETCFVVEMSTGGDFETVAFLPPSDPTHPSWYEELSGPGHRAYRVYAATADARSEYSNTDTVNAVYSPPGTPPPPRQRGDLNCDGVTDTRDMLAVLRESAGLDPHLPSGCAPLDRLVAAGSGGVSTIGPIGTAFEAPPTPPDDCYAASQPSLNGPDAPSALNAGLGRYYSDGTHYENVDFVS